MKSTEKAIREFCGHHADWWPSTTQVQEMLALAQPCSTCAALARTVMLDQTSHDIAPPQRTWVGLTEDEAFACKGRDYFETYKAIEAKLRSKNEIRRRRSL